MGGANSEIIGDTAMVLFESANFSGTSIHRTAAALNMRTEASSRYEKGLDPMNTLKAVQRACELVELLGAGEVVDGVMDVIAKDSAPVTVQLEPAKLNRFPGTDIPEEEMRRILLSLGFGLEGDTILVPSWRSDVEHWSDIAEEVARFYGYNKIPDTLSSGLNQRRGFSPEQKAEKHHGRPVPQCRVQRDHHLLLHQPLLLRQDRSAQGFPLRTSMKILNPWARIPPSCAPPRCPLCWRS